MAELYPQIHWLHVAAVIASGALFLLRGSLVLTGAQGLAMAAPLRYLSYTIDTVLLAAAVTLAVVLKLHPFEQSWLMAKILLLLLYIVLGSLALKRARSRAARAVFFVAAVATYLFIVSIALAHHPLGVFRSL